MPARPASTLLAALVACALVAPAGTLPEARAGEGDDPALAMAKESFDLAEKSYALGKFDDALKQYERAFELKQLPPLLFNIGQCHRNLGNWERASFFYQGYLAREPKARNRDKVQALIEQMNAKVREQEEARRAAAALAAKGPPPTPATPAPTSAGVPAGNALATAPEPVPGASVAATPTAPPAEETPTWRKWWVWTLVGVAVAGGVAVAVVATNPSTSTSNLNGSLGAPIDATR